MATGPWRRLRNPLPELPLALAICYPQPVLKPQLEHV